MGNYDIEFMELNWLSQAGTCRPNFGENTKLYQNIWGRAKHS